MNKSPKPAIFRFEHRSQPVLRWPAFLKRLATSFALGLALILASLYAGMAGYHYFEKLSWIDAFVNAAMILSGMGPLAQPATQNGKLFAGLYAIYSGLAVVMIAGITFAPVVHRFLHKLHADEADSK
ncbi:MAG: hypothetical protein ABI977_02590 [Acidobacteriota bacterium]